MRPWLAFFAATAALLTVARAQDNDVVLRAMHDELERARMFRVASPDPPYYVEYEIEDADVVAINASLGALISENHSGIKVPSVRVRLGTPAFDNANYVFSDYFTGTRMDPAELPLDTTYGTVRQILWLATDRAFKTAEEGIGRKRSALKNVNLTENLPDYSAAPAIQSVSAIPRTPVDEAAWKNRIVKLSGIFANYPAIDSSGIEFQTIEGTTYLTNTEGANLRYSDALTFLRARAFTQAPDGMVLRDAEVFHSDELSLFPSELDLKRGITAVADELTALTKAPVGETYDGPVLFEARAAAQLFAQVLGDNLKIARKPVPEPGRNVPYMPSELETKVGARILPDWMDVVDDPTQTEWRGQPLFGHYIFDMEGVKPQPLNLVEKGVLKTFLLTRTPVMKGFEATNGHARMRGNFGQMSAGFGNLFIRASQSSSSDELKKKLIDLVKQGNKPYGILVRKLDYPSGMSFEELRHALSAMAQSGGGTRPVALPLLVYRVYPDGREELVRGLRFRGLSTRSLKDITAAGNDSYVFNYMDSPAPFALMGAGNFVINTSVISPGILFDELELERIQEDLPKLPIVPPPPMGS
jgi:predicted Zn-dependent protease